MTFTYKIIGKDSISGKELIAEGSVITDSWYSLPEAMIKIAGEVTLQFGTNYNEITIIKGIKIESNQIKKSLQQGH